MITEREFQSLKADHENSRSEAERAEGALSQLMASLKTEFGCKRMEDAEALLKDLEGKKVKAEAQLEKSLQAYQNKWKLPDAD